MTNDRVIVVGAGIAGAATALELAPLPVLVIAPRTTAMNAATRFAQGGIAAAVGMDDDPSLHAADTQDAGAGLCDAAMATRVTQAGPEVIGRLLAWGVEFDRDGDGAIALGLEAAHSRARILHAGGDSTGRAALGVLVARLKESDHVERRSDLKAERLLVEDGRVAGVWCRDDYGVLEQVRGRAVVLATGGIGGLYASTTNPLSAVGCGLAMASRAGAVLRDIEFVQFHPTAIAAASDPMPLATEALRGAGAVLVNDAGEPVMVGTPGGDLAPRDVVARALHAQIAEGRRVFLDARGAVGARFQRDFPSVHALCRKSGIDPEQEMIPVRPAAHYHMGGIKVNGAGRSSLPGLYACGEVASTGLHGANRLASNSLLEALAFARWISEDIKARDLPPARVGPILVPSPLGMEGGMESIRRIMDRHVGVERSAGGLGAAVRLLAPRMGDDDAAFTAALMAAAALAREESRGGHYRADFPSPAEEISHTEFTLSQAMRRFPILAAAAMRETA